MSPALTAWCKTLDASPQVGRIVQIPNSGTEDRTRCCAPQGDLLTRTWNAETLRAPQTHPDPGAFYLTNHGQRQHSDGTCVQIGREWCRGRGCQEVELLGVAAP